MKIYFYKIFCYNGIGGFQYGITRCFRKRRSIRKYQATKVSDEMIHQIIDAAI